MEKNRKKSIGGNDPVYIPTSPAELKIATEPEGIGAILPQTPTNLKALQKRINSIQKFDIEYAFALKKAEQLDKLQKEIEKAIATGKPVSMSDYESLPLLRAKVGKFGMKMVKSFSQM